MKYLLMLSALVLLTSCQTLPLFQSSRPSSSPAPPSAPAPNIIISENAQPGTRDWMVTTPGYSTQIQAYASATSVSAGQTLTFYASTASVGTPYTAQLFRLGWYGGAGGRLLWSASETGQAQGIYDPSSRRLLGCASCFIDPVTHLTQANWQPSFRMTIPSDWVTGRYEAKLTNATGQQTIVPFVVRGSATSTYLVMLADNTSEAYNDWGGYSLYHGLDGTAHTRAFKDSFDRPYDNSLFATGNGLPYEIDAIRWLERNGYDVSYVSSTDVNEQPGQLLSHRALIDIGHDEYWSLSMYNGIEQARDAGVSLAFLGANDGFWQIRYEPDRAGVPERTIVCYRYANLDPMYGKNNALVTVNWRSSPLNRPENALIGIAYANQRTTPPAAAPWRVSPAAAKDSLLAGTGLHAGARYGCNLVGYEWDEVLSNDVTPIGLTVLGASPVITRLGKVQIADTTYYLARSGAFVFASGSIYWNYALDDLRLWDFSQVLPTLLRDPCLLQSRSTPGIQALMRHIMQALLS